MFRTLLVPLDRSVLAEQALPWAVSIAQRAEARLDLVQVHVLYALEERATSLVTFDPGRDAEFQKQEQLYLDGTATWLGAMVPVGITTAILPGSAVLPETVAASLLERAQAEGADLIVMATHGRGPLGRFGRGSVADELLRRASVPILLVQSTEKAPDLIPAPVLENVLIPLDGSPLAEEVVTPALELARLMAARCRLLRVVETSTPPDADSLKPAITEAAEYLARIAARFHKECLPVQTRVVTARIVSAAILEEATGLANNLIALATHGRSGLQRLLLGSVADKVIRGASSPVLVYHPLGK